MSGLSGYVALATFGNKVLTLLQTLAGIYQNTEAKKSGATAQREGDLRDEIERNNAARDAADDPAVDDPAGVRSDPANRFPQG